MLQIDIVSSRKYCDYTSTALQIYTWYILFYCTKWQIYTWYIFFYCTMWQIYTWYIVFLLYNVTNLYLIHCVLIVQCDKFILDTFCSYCTKLQIYNLYCDWVWSHCTVKSERLGDECTSFIPGLHPVLKLRISWNLKLLA